MVTTNVLVGYDGSAGSEQARHWALAEAERTRAAVQLVYAWVWPTYLPAVSMVPGASVWPDGEAAAAVDAMLDGAVTASRREHPNVPVTSAVEHGPAALVLRDRADADLLVVGGRSHGAVAGLLLGSVASAVAAHARCPVVVVRGEQDAAGGRPVVAGLDDSPRAESVARFAFEQAAARGAAVAAVRAWMPPVDPWIGNRFVDRDAISAAEQRALDALLSGWRARFPAVPVTTHVQVGHPYRVLADAAREAQLVVVAARGRGGFPGLRVGSVTRHLLHHGHSTIAVLRDPGP